MPISFSNTQRVSKNTRLSNNISEALIRALGINNLNNDATVNQLKDAISAKLSAIGGGVTPENLLAILSDVGNVQGSIVNDELALNTAYLTVSNMTTLTDAQINVLACGDTVVKEDSSGKHQYIVTYKKDEVGICITYFDATYLETVSYDYTDGHWVYNSTDVTDLTEKQDALTTTSVPDGTIDKSIGFDLNGDLVKGQASSGGGLTLKWSGSLALTSETVISPFNFERGKDYFIQILFGSGEYYQPMNICHAPDINDGYDMCVVGLCYNSMYARQCTYSFKVSYSGGNQVFGNCSGYVISTTISAETTYPKIVNIYEVN